MRANKFFLTRRLLNKGLLFKTCLMLVLSTSASLASICSLVHGHCEDFDINGVNSAYVSSNVNDYVSDKQDGISGCSGFPDKGAAPYTTNSSPWPAYARKNGSNNSTQYACSACVVNNKVVVDSQGYARWKCYRKCDDVSNTGAHYVDGYTVDGYANRPYRDRFVRSQAQCNEKFGKIEGTDVWATKYVVITPNVCGRCKPIEELTDDEKCENGMALSSYPKDYPCYYPCKNSYTLKDGTECCADSSWEKMPEDYHPEYWTGKCYNTKTEKAASGRNCYKQTEIRVREETSVSSVRMPNPFAEDEDWEESTSGTTTSGNVAGESGEDEVVCGSGKVWNDYNKSYDSTQNQCECVFEKCEGNTIRGGEDGVTCVACGGILQANADHTACGCPEDMTENDNGECVCIREGAVIVDGTCMCPAGKFATIRLIPATNCPAGMSCAHQRVMVCSPCEDYTYTAEPNLASSCSECPEGTVANDDHTGCVCENGGELIDGECVCPEGSTLTDGVCVCSAGFELTDGACQCPTGKYITYKTDYRGMPVMECDVTTTTININGIPAEVGKCHSVQICRFCTGNTISTELNSTTCMICGTNSVSNDDHTACVCPEGAETYEDGTCGCLPYQVMIDGFCEDDRCVLHQYVCAFGGENSPCTDITTPMGDKKTEEEIAQCTADGGYMPKAVVTQAGTQCYYDCVLCESDEIIIRDENGDGIECGACPEGSVANSDHTACVCENGGELIDGECACPEGKGLFNGQCTELCEAGYYMYEFTSHYNGDKTWFCDICEDGTYTDEPNLSLSCTACPEGLVSNENHTGCGEDPCTARDATWHSKLPSPAVYMENNVCYYYSNTNYEYITSDKMCYKPVTYDMGPTEEECAAAGASLLRNGNPSPCGPAYTCKCPTGTTMNENGTQCVCDNGGELVDGECVCTGNKVMNSDNMCVSCPDGTTASDGVCVCNIQGEVLVNGECVCPAGNHIDHIDDSSGTGSRRVPRTVCVACDENEISTAINSEMCTMCPEGATANEDHTGCVCTNGGELVDGECVCPEGKGLFNGQCTELCEAGYYMYEFTSHYNGDKTWFCDICEDGTYTDEPNLSLSCTACPEGLVSNEDHTGCQCSEDRYPYVKANSTAFSSSIICNMITMKVYRPACQIYLNGHVTECTHNGVTRFGCADGYYLSGNKCVAGSE